MLKNDNVLSMFKSLYFSHTHRGVVTNMIPVLNIFYNLSNQLQDFIITSFKLKYSQQYQFQHLTGSSLKQSNTEQYQINEFVGAKNDIVVSIF